MSGKTHLLIGANAVWIVPLLGNVDNFTPFLIAIGAFGALLPDIDAVSATIHYKAGGLFGMFKGMFRHRGFFHSFVAITLVFLISFVFLSWINIWIAPVLTLGYFSHMFIDAFNKGMWFFWPLKREVTFVPRVLWTRVGGSMDHTFFILASLGLVLFFAMNISYFKVDVSTLFALQHHY